VRALWDGAGTGRLLLGVALAILAALVVGRLMVNNLRVYELQFGLYLSLFLFLVHHVLGAARVELPEAVRAVPRFVADFSYSLYLTHFTLLTWLGTRVAGGALDREAAVWYCLIGSNALAIVFWALFERHHRRLMRAVVRRFSNRGAIAPRTAE
jgi:peptidoglycan/LPS O-acetylase OafA/YrhL